MQKLPKLVRGLSITEVAGETIVYDGSTAKAHCLDARGGRVLAACRDGVSRQELVDELGSADVVEAVLSELQILGLLDGEAGIGRRRILAAAGAGVASVLVASVAAPTPAAAATVQNCQLDMSNRPCNCDRCGMTCSGTQGGPSSTVTCGTTTVTSGPEAAGRLCSFEYDTINTSLDPVNNPCLGQGSGDYGCRPVTLGVNFSYECNAARTLVGNGLYYCCHCSGALATRTC